MSKTNFRILAQIQEFQAASPILIDILEVEPVKRALTRAIKRPIHLTTDIELKHVNSSKHHIFPFQCAYELYTPCESGFITLIFQIIESKDNKIPR